MPLNRRRGDTKNNIHLFKSIPMKKHILSISIIAVIAMLATGFIYSNITKSNKKALKNLSGTYADPKGVDWGSGTFGTREFTFDKGKWTLKFILALDPEMKNEVFIFRTVGTYKVLNKSKTVANAYNAVFIEDKKFVTLKTGDPNLIQGFGFAPCNFTKDVEKDISETGCSLWKSVKDCKQDYDLLSLGEDGKLYFGLRPADNDMCTADKRPTKLYVPVMKIK